MQARLEGYDLGRWLGKGSFGTVRVAERLVDRSSFAAKIVPAGKMNDDQLRREISNQKLLDHPHVVRVFDVIEDASRTVIVMELVPGEELFSYIVHNRKLSESESRRILCQLVAGLEHMHGRFVAHRDLKPENVMLDAQRNAKITDFGLSAKFQPGELLTDSVGSPNYVAPEVLQKRPAYDGRGVDVWATGAILYAMLVGELPFDEPELPRLFKLIRLGHYRRVPGFLSQDAREFIAEILVVDPKKRLGTAGISAHAWILSGQVNAASIGGGSDPATCARDWDHVSRTVLTDMPDATVGAGAHAVSLICDDEQRDRVLTGTEPRLSCSDQCFDACREPIAGQVTTDMLCMESRVKVLMIWCVTICKRHGGDVSEKVKYAPLAVQRLVLRAELLQKITASELQAFDAMLPATAPLTARVALWRAELHRLCGNDILLRLERECPLVQHTLLRAELFRRGLASLADLDAPQPVQLALWKAELHRLRRGGVVPLVQTAAPAARSIIRLLVILLRRQVDMTSELKAVLRAQQLGAHERSSLDAATNCSDEHARHALAAVRTQSSMFFPSVLSSSGMKAHESVKPNLHGGWHPIWLVTLRSVNKPILNALRCGPHLEPVREKLLAQGCNPWLPHFQDGDAGASIFVEPHEFMPATQAVLQQGLRLGRHEVLVSNHLMCYLEKELSAISGGKIRFRESRIIGYSCGSDMGHSAGLTGIDAATHDHTVEAFTGAAAPSLCSSGQRADRSCRTRTPPNLSMAAAGLWRTWSSQSRLDCGRRAKWSSQAF